MKLAIAVLVAGFTGSLAIPSTIEHGVAIGADSTMGLSILSKARRVEDNDEEDFTWIAGYSLKFQGCHHVTQWNEEGGGDDDVRLATKRLVRFRLCPADYCTAESAAGCNSGYGDYIIDMNTFIDAYMENKNEVEQYTCEYTSEYVCDCEDSDDKGDDFDREQCSTIATWIMVLTTVLRKRMMMLFRNWMSRNTWSVLTLIFLIMGMVVV